MDVPVVQKPPSLAKQRAQAKARKRMTAIVESFQSYVASYTNQAGYVDYTDRTLIDDMLYGIGRAIDESRYSRALREAAGMPLAEVSYRLPDGARIEAMRREGVAASWAVLRDGRVLHVDGTWGWAKVSFDEAYLRTCRFDTERDAYDAWLAVAVMAKQGQSSTRRKHRTA